MPYGRQGRNGVRASYSQREPARDQDRREAPLPVVQNDWVRSPPRSNWGQAPARRRPWRPAVPEIVDVWAQNFDADFGAFAAILRRVTSVPGMGIVALDT